MIEEVRRWHALTRTPQPMHARIKCVRLHAYQPLRPSLHLHRQVRALQEVLKPLLLRRMKEDVETLPEKEEVGICVYVRVVCVYICVGGDGCACGALGGSTGLQTAAGGSRQTDPKLLHRSLVTEMPIHTNTVLAGHHLGGADYRAARLLQGHLREADWHRGWIRVDKGAMGG